MGVLASCHLASHSCGHFGHTLLQVLAASRGLQMISSGRWACSALVQGFLGTEDAEAEAHGVGEEVGSVMPENTERIQFSQAINRVLKMQMEPGL